MKNFDERNKSNYRFIEPTFSIIRLVKNHRSMQSWESNDDAVDKILLIQDDFLTASGFRMQTSKTFLGETTLTQHYVFRNKFPLIVVTFDDDQQSAEYLEKYWQSILTKAHKPASNKLVSLISENERTYLFDDRKIDNLKIRSPLELYINDNLHYVRTKTQIFVIDTSKIESILWSVHEGHPYFVS